MDLAQVSRSELAWMVGISPSSGFSGFTLLAGSALVGSRFQHRNWQMLQNRAF